MTLDIYWKNHYEFIISLVKLYKPNLVLYENTNFISNRTSDSLNLIRLLVALECLNVKQVNSINVLTFPSFSFLLEARSEAKRKKKKKEKIACAWA